MKRLLLFMLLAMQACNMEDFGDADVFLYNRSGLSIASYPADGTNSGFSYPDTLLPRTINAFHLKENIISEDWVLSWCAPSYKHLLSGTQAGVLSVFVFNQAIVNDEGWESVLSHQNYMVRYDLTAKDLESLQGAIYFPPSDAMRNVRMFPPYEEVIQKYPAIAGKITHHD